MAIKATAILDGKALKIVQSMSSDPEDPLNYRRYSRLCGMVGASVARKALQTHGKSIPQPPRTEK